MTPAPAARASTGIEGLDDILHGGFTTERLYLIEGMPGSGKTTLAFQFLIEGARKGEPVLYVTLSETEEEIRTVAESHGWSLDGVSIKELMPTERALDASEQYTVFHPAEIELIETTTRLLKDVERIRPKRVVFDSLSELRLLAGSTLRYRRQILALKQFFAGRQCTVLMLDDLSGGGEDKQVQSIAHGAILLQTRLPGFGIERRQVSITKFRGSAFRGGHHDFVIHRGGLRVFPRLVAADHRSSSNRQRLPSGLSGLDKLLGGGMECGTSTLIQGAAGAGKSTIGALFAAETTKNGRKAAMFIFDESLNTLRSRMRGLGVDLDAPIKEGTLTVTQVDPAELSPGELAYRIRDAVERQGVSMVIIDSLNGYLQSMPDESFLIVQLHELLTYLGQSGVASIIIAAQQGMMGGMQSSVDVSYLADSVILMRYFESEGAVHQAISVVKMRGGEHERTIREFIMKDSRVTIGEPLRDYRGVLTGIPEKMPKP